MFSFAVRGNPNNTSDLLIRLLSFSSWREHHECQSRRGQARHMIYSKIENQFLILRQMLAQGHNVSEKCKQSGEVHSIVSATACTGSCQYTHAMALCFGGKKT